jgi:hypothetical protein
MLSEVADLSGTTEARIEAARRVGEFLKKHAESLWVNEDWQMDVTNELGLILFVLTVRAESTPATSGSFQKPPVPSLRS